MFFTMKACLDVWKTWPFDIFFSCLFTFFLLLSLSLPMPLRLLVQILRIFFPNAFRSAEVMEDFRGHLF